MKIFLYLLLFFVCVISTSRAQDPSQPALNLGLTGTLDGAPPSTGLLYISYFEYYNSDELRSAQGQVVADIDLQAYVWLHQFAYISEQKWMGANLGFSVLFPFVFLNSSGTVGTNPVGQPVELTENTRRTGDLIVAPIFQWFDKRLFGKPFFHRFEPSLILPVGSYSQDYLLNPGSNYFSFQPFYAFTLFLSNRLAISQRHHYTYHFENPANEERTGQLYHGIYSVELEAFQNFWVAIQGYHVQQLTDDRQRGETLPDAVEERVSAAGLSLNWFSKNGWAIGGKTLIEFGARGRPQGIRSRLRVIKQFSLKKKQRLIKL